MDYVASRFPSTLEPVSFKLSSTLTADARAELVVELQFYGLLDRVIPYYTQDQIGGALLKRACVTGRGIHSFICQLSLSRFHL
jgi:hypothetical protein